MAVNKNTIRADIYKEIYSVLDSELSTGFVTGSFNGTEGDLPQVVLYMPLVPRTRQAMGTESVSYDRECTMDIEVYGSTVQEVTELVDEIEATLFSNLNSLSIKNLSMGTGDIAPLELNASWVQITTIPLTFKIKR